MSRIGKQPIELPSAVTVTQSGRKLDVKGPKGQLGIELRPEVQVEIAEKSLEIQTTGHGPARQASAFHGMTRALVANMVQGVSKGFEKALEIQGVGWNAKAQGKQLVLNIGFCHSVDLPVPEGLTVETGSPTSIKISGIDKQLVGQFAAQIRAVRPPEPYKGKGIRYVGEYVRRKAGKSFGS